MCTIHVGQVSVLRWRCGVTLAASLLFIHCALPLARSAEIQWNGGFNQSWHQVFNWNPFGSPFSIRRIPSDIDTANLLTPAGDDVFLFGDTEPINGLIMSNGIDLFTNGFLLEVDNAGSATASIAGAGRLFVEPRTGGGNAFETDNLFLTGGGVLQLDGGDALVQGNSTIFGGSLILGSGGESIDFGGNVSVLNSSVLILSNGATASFAPGTTISAEVSSTIDLEQTVNVINGVSFEITTSARMEATNLNIGNDEGALNGSDGTLILDQAGASEFPARLDVSQNLTIGSQSSGTALMHVKNALASIDGQTTIYETGALLLEGSRFGVNDLLLVNQGTIMATNQDDPILLSTGARLNVHSGGRVHIDGDQAIGDDGRFDIALGAELNVTGTLTVGAGPFGAGRLVVGTSSTVEVGEDLVIGDHGFAGTAFFVDAMVAADNIQVGLNGTGTLDVSFLAVLSSASGQIGVNPGSMGTATVKGAAVVESGEWNVANTLAVGISGTGNLTISDGGKVTSTTGILGADGSGVGTATVTGANSNWTMTGNLLLGGGQLGDLGGEGTLFVQTGGSVNVGNILRIYTNGRLVLDGGTLTTPTFDFQGGEFNWVWVSGTLHVETYPRNLVNSGGTLAPGESAGSTTILGNYTQQSGAALEIEIGGASAGGTYDLVSITGNAVLGGDLLLELINDFVPANSDTFTVLSALGGIAGVFDNVTTGGRLATTDGLGSFLVHYGAGSSNPNQIVLSQFLPTFTADFDRDGDVDGDDLTVWQAAFGAGNGADADADGDSDGADFLAWQRQLGSGVPSQALSRVVPEPSSLLLLILTCVALRRPLTRLSVVAAARRPVCPTT
jgi:T5SS/PEP-CTERM-associated repeat protein